MDKKLSSLGNYSRKRQILSATACSSQISGDIDAAKTVER